MSLSQKLAFNFIRRRAFLKSASLAAVGGSLGAVTAAADDSSAPASASSNAPRLLPGCCAYSYAAHLKTGQMAMEDFIARAVELGVVGVDITTYWLKSREPAYLAGLRRLGYRMGMPFSGFAIGADLCQPDAAKRAETVAGVRRWIDATERAGASHLRVFGDHLPAGATETQGIQWVAETMKAACEYAAERGVTLGIETHGGLSINASHIVEILRQVDSPFAGCNLDISNFHERPYEQIAQCAPYATHTHIRDFYGPRRTPLDLDRVWRIFAGAGYKGFMSAEYEGEEDPLTGVPKLVGKIKTLCRKYSSV